LRSHLRPAPLITSRKQSPHLVKRGRLPYDLGFVPPRGER
jgi:hypothetical protein